jgi:dihydroorotase/N-acyl-D-amino-acid deacylase
VRPGGFEVPANKSLENKSLSEIAAIRQKEWVDVLIDLTVEEQARLGATYFIASEDNLALQIKQPWIKFGTDAGSNDPDSTHGAETHPRAYGTYPKILGQFVREQRVLPLEDAIRKMSSAAAERLSLADRGVLRPGYFADVVIFDPATVIDRATYERSHQFSTGIRDVLVNGVAVLRNGAYTGAKPGRALRGPGWTGKNIAIFSGRALKQ